MSSQRGNRVPRICITCKHLSPVVTKDDQFYCEAYPDGIPSIFIQGLYEHITPYRQRNDIVWTPKEKVTDGTDQE